MMNGEDDTTMFDAPQRRLKWTGQLSAIQWALLAVAMLVLLLGAAGEPARLWLRYDRDAILQGHEYWRLVTGHLVHVDARHLVLNLAGMALISSLCRGCYLLRHWLWLVVLIVVCIDSGFLLLMPGLNWYVGLSGVLHGVLAAGAVRWWRIESPWLAGALTLILGGKLVWEQWQGALPLAGDISVVVNAHLYGALGGLLGGLLCAFFGGPLGSLVGGPHRQDRDRRLSGSRTVT